MTHINEFHKTITNLKISEHENSSHSIHNQQCLLESILNIKYIKITFSHHPGMTHRINKFTKIISKNIIPNIVLTLNLSCTTGQVYTMYHACIYHAYHANQL